MVELPYGSLRVEILADKITWLHFSPVMLFGSKYELIRELDVFRKVRTKKKCLVS